MDEGDQSSKNLDSESGCDKAVEETRLSKNQLKKLRKREKWLAIKQEKRRHSKENRKRRLAEMREKGEETGPTRKSLKSNRMENSACKIKVVLDLSLDEYMSEKDVSSLTCQLQHSYSANRRAENPMQLYMCGLHGKTLKRLEEIGDYKGWDMFVETKNYDEIFPKESLVYLSSESPNILSSLSEEKVYIIGGLVDHNQHKGLCHRIAEEKGIAHAQLPIAEYLNMKTRKVLAVNHVFSILLRYTEKNDWQEAFLAEMPQRKQAHLKQEDKAKMENADSKSGISSDSETLPGTSNTSDISPQEISASVTENTSQATSTITEASESRAEKPMGTSTAVSSSQDTLVSESLPYKSPEGSNCSNGDTTS